ncbi:MAG: guanylate kinase [Pseudomonadota bacterium]
MKRKGRLIIVTAPSGTGKTSVIHRFLSAHPDMIHSVSCTTRPIRKGEVDGRDYHFIDREEFSKGIDDGKFAEWAEVHNNFYGTPNAPLEAWLAAGTDVLLDVDVVGSLSLKKIYGGRAISIFLVPPTMDELKRRLALRGTDLAEVQALRLKNALTEMTFKDRFDHQVVNDVLDRACAEIGSIIGRDPS